MKKFITRNSLVILALLMSSVSFAQGDFGDPADIDPLDAPVAPIGDYIWVVAVIGIMYVFYKLNNRKKLA